MKIVTTTDELLAMRNEAGAIEQVDAMKAECEKLRKDAEQQPDVTQLVEALAELCDEIDKHEIHAAISKTSISWFKLKARKALADYRKGAKP